MNLRARTGGSLSPSNRLACSTNSVVAAVFVLCIGRQGLSIVGDEVVLHPVRIIDFYWRSPGQSSFGLLHKLFGFGDGGFGVGLGLAEQTRREEGRRLRAS